MIDQKFTLREIYHIIISRKCSFDKIVLRWNKHGMAIEWEKVTSNVKHVINDTLKNFYIMFNSRSIPLNNVISHFTPVSEFCSLCKGVKETYYHLFWECPKVKSLWNYVHSLVMPEFATPQMSLFPTGSHKAVFLFTLCKHYIHTCRIFSKAPSVHALKQKLNFHLSALKATLHMRAQDDKFEKLGHTCSKN